MSPAWSLPFAALIALAAWCRLRPAERLVGLLTPVLRFFGVGGVPARSAAADLFAIAGVAGLLFVAWSHRLEVASDLWLALDAVLSSLGLGLAGSWLLARAGGEEDPAPATSRELAMMEVDELPQRGESGPHGPGAPGGLM